MYFRKLTLPTLKIAIQMKEYRDEIQPSGKKRTYPETANYFGKNIYTVIHYIRYIEKYPDLVNETLKGGEQNA